MAKVFLSRSHKALPKCIVPLVWERKNGILGSSMPPFHRLCASQKIPTRRCVHILTRLHIPAGRPLERVFASFASPSLVSRERNAERMDQRDIEQSYSKKQKDQEAEITI